MLAPPHWIWLWAAVPHAASQAYRGNGTTRPRVPVPMRVSRYRPQVWRAHPTASATDSAAPLAALLRRWPVADG